MEGEIPESIKENVRAVLLSKTDGSGILVSRFLSDYRSYIQEPLKFKDMGYANLEVFIKKLPDVCRLEYSDVNMAYKLYGIPKPNTFVSSFVKRAATGNKNDRIDEDTTKKDRSDKIRPTSDVNEKWLPNSRGLFSLCFHHKKHGLSKEQIAMKFAQAGEVVEINMTESLSFIRYNNENDAKKAVSLWGDSIGVKRADEKVVHGGRQGRENNKGGNSDRKNQSNRNNNNRGFTKRKREDQASVTVTSAAESDDESWDQVDGHGDTRTVNVKPDMTNLTSLVSDGSKRGSDQGDSSDHSDRRGTRGRGQMGQQNAVTNQDSGKSVGRNNRDSRSNQNITQRQSQNVQGSDIDRQFRNQGRKEGQAELPSSNDKGTGKAIQVYVGNWPKEGDKSELLNIVKDYNHCGCRIMSDKKDSCKSYAFVDFMNVDEAILMVHQLNKFIYKNRDLQVRMGKNSGMSDSEVEERLKNLTLANGSNKGNNSAQVTPGSRSDKSDHNPGGRRPVKSEHSLQRDSNGYNVEDEIPPLEPLVSPSIPPLERRPQLSPNIPPLERPVNQSRKQASQNNPPFERVTNQSRQNFPVNMPPLEKNQSWQHFPANMPPLEKNQPRQHFSPNIPPLEMNNGRYGEDLGMQYIEPRGAMGANRHAYVQLFVSNFPYGTRQEDLREVFHSYGVVNIKMMNQSVVKRSTYAYITIGDIASAEQAMENLDQTIFGGRRLTVTMMDQDMTAMTGGGDHAGATNHIPNITCTVSGEAERTVSVQDVGYSSDVKSGGAADFNQDSNAVRSQRHFVVQNDFNRSKLTNKLREFKMINSRLRDEDYLDQFVGMTLKVMITHVENEKFFWAQILEDSVNGQNANLQRFKNICLDLQDHETQIDGIKGLGRCCAPFEGAWYRAWCTFDTMRKGVEMSDIFYVDYGNTAMLPKEELVYTKSQLWNIPPMAKPFKLTAPNMDLPNMVNKVAIVQVHDVGSPQNNFLCCVEIMSIQ